MGYPLTVEENEVGRCLQFTQSREYRRPFPEGEKTRDIGKTGTGDGVSGMQELKPGI
jgi:hypothetical protein